MEYKPGYLLNGQERKLVGGTSLEIYAAQPHKPCVVIDEKMSVEDCNRERMKFGFFPTDIGRYWGKEGGVNVSFEPLDLNPNSPKY